MKIIQNRLNNILLQLEHLKDIKVINIISVGGPGFVGKMDYKLKEPITIQEAYSINKVNYPFTRGYTVYLEDGRYIMVRLDIEDNPVVYLKF